MSMQVVARLKQHFGDRVLDSSDFRGDDEVRVAPTDWQEVARFVRDDEQCTMDHFIDLTAIDHPEREQDGEGARFDVVVSCRSMQKRHRVRLRTRVADGQELDTLIGVWIGADWAEREVWDMFGIRFRGHPDLRRILMYEEFEGHALRKDYPIERAQPLIPYRQVAGVEKVMPFGGDEGQPWGRIAWEQRQEGRDLQVSPAIALQQRQRTALSSDAASSDESPNDSSTD